jgi:hypothetical protein
MAKYIQSKWKPSEGCKGWQIDMIVLDMPLLNTMKYKDLNEIESLISDLILQLLKMNEKEYENDKKKKYE